MVYQNRKSLIVLFWVFLFGFVFQDANAWTGKLKPFFDSDSEAQNWAVPKYPKIVIALGFLQPEFVGNYASLSFEYFSKRGNTTFNVVSGATVLFTTTRWYSFLLAKAFPICSETFLI